MNKCKYMDMKCEYANRLGMCKNTTAICARKSKMILIDSEPLDAVQVVRCKDCKWSDVDSGGIFCEQYGRVPKDDWFCAGGERR